MWVINKSGFFSVVQHNKDADVLMIRARVVDDLVRAFPDDTDKIVEMESADYRYRISLPRKEVEAWMLEELDDVTYTSHAKEEMSKGKPGRHAAYMRVWGILGDLQPGGPYGQNNRSTFSEPVTTQALPLDKIMFSNGEVVETVGETEHDVDLVRIDGELIEVYAIEDDIECGTCGEPVMLSIDGQSWEHAFTDEDDDHEPTGILSTTIFDEDTRIYTDRDPYVEEIESRPSSFFAGRTFTPSSSSTAMRQTKNKKTDNEMAKAISQLKGRLNNE